MGHKQFLDEARRRMEAAGLLPGELNPAPGRFIRCGTVGKENGLDGSYKLLSLDPAIMYWANWRTGKSGFHCDADWTAMPEAERRKVWDRYRKTMEADRRAREADQQEAARAAQEEWANGQKVLSSEHDYLKKKKVQSWGLKVSRAGDLMVPIFGVGADGKSLQLHTLQYIRRDGSKRFFPGGKKAGGFFLIQGDVDAAKEGPILLAEGYATAATLRLLTGCTSIMAVDCGNLIAAGKAIQRRFPGRRLILVADNDFDTPDNPGVKFARAAALELGLEDPVVSPGFTDPKTGFKVTDFNDLWCLHKDVNDPGLKELRERIASPEPDTGRDGFRMRADGLYFQEPGKGSNDKGEPEHLCSWFEVQARTRSTEAGDWGLRIRLKDPDGVDHAIDLPATALGPKGDYASPLLAAGLNWYAGGRRYEALRRYLSLTNAKTKARARMAEKPGWFGSKNAQYVMPTGEVFGQNPGDPEQVYLAGKVTTKEDTAGTLKEWQAHIANPAKGNSRLVLALCFSLAPTLRPFTRQGSGGINLVGPSSSGKSTVLRAAASVWGQQENWFYQWRATGNGVETLAQDHNDALLAMDEVKNSTAKDLEHCAWVLGNGAGKIRANKDGSTQAIRRFNTWVLSTGEKGFTDRLAEEGIKTDAGLELRLIDIPSDAGQGLGIFDVKPSRFKSSGAFADAIKEASDKYYGTAARFFIDYLLAHPQEAEQAAQQALEDAECMCPQGAENQVRRVARNVMGPCLAAGRLAIESGLVPNWQEGEVQAAIEKCLTAFLDRRGSPGDLEAHKVCDAMLRVLRTCGDTSFADAYTGERKGSKDLFGYKVRFVKAGGKLEEIIGAPGKGNSGPVEGDPGPTLFFVKRAQIKDILHVTDEKPALEYLAKGKIWIRDQATLDRMGEFDQPLTIRSSHSEKRSPGMVQLPRRYKEATPGFYLLLTTAFDDEGEGE